MYSAFLVLTLLPTGHTLGQVPIQPIILLPPVPCPCVCVPCPAEVRTANYAAPKRDVVLLWNDTALMAIKADRTPPPIAARNLAVVHAAVYDAVNAVYATHEPYRVIAAAKPGSSAAAAAAVAAHRVLLSLYPRLVERFDAALDESLASVAEGPAKTDGIALGQAVAEKMLEWRQSDAPAQQSEYASSSALGRWQPTPPDYRAPLLPRWASLPCFAMRSGSQFRPAGPPALDSAAFVASYKEVKALGAANSSVRTADQTVIAHFWADGDGTVTPPGHWNRIAQTVAAQRQNSIADNARLFAMLNVALADAGVACWDCKYQFDYWRPVTAIRAAVRLNNAALVADADWTPLLPTPPFPSYTSGHSTFSAAAAAALTAFFGNDVRFTSESDGLPGVTRSYVSFAAAAEEAGLSRIYGGIHWDFDNRDGLAMGRALGEYVSKNAFQPKATRAERSVPVNFATRRR
jgi:membrane-associated phospholipid phosphatase